MAVEATSCSAPGSGVDRAVRSSSGKMRACWNHSASAGWCTRTGERVVGRRTPGSLTRSPTREFTSVDLPAPVEPPTTVRSGRVDLDQPRQHVVLQLVDHRQPALALLLDPGDLEREAGELQRLAQAVRVASSCAELSLTDRSWPGCGPAE